MTKEIIIAATPLKGSLSAIDAVHIIKNLIEQVFSGIKTASFPLADGGDDTLELLKYYDNQYNELTVAVTGPLENMTVSADFLAKKSDNIAVVEAAQAHGLVLLPKGELDILGSTSYGVGELVLKALNSLQPEQEKKIVITLGGSASTDGGCGALQAMGYRFYNTNQQLIEAPITGKLLSEIHAIKAPYHPIDTTTLTIATDVINPLLGPEGTAAVYSPQKGATPDIVEYFEQELSRISDIFHRDLGFDHKNIPGSGAAGGLGYGLSYLPNTTICSGFQWLTQSIGLTQKLQQAKLIITTEGYFDHQSLSGKAPGKLIEMARSTPVILFCGDYDKSLTLPENLYIYTLTSELISKENAIKYPEKALQEAFNQAKSTISGFLAAGDSV